MDSPGFQLRTSESCENILEFKWAKSLKDKAANFKRDIQNNKKVFRPMLSEKYLFLFRKCIGFEIIIVKHLVFSGVE